MKTSTNFLRRKFYWLFVTVYFFTWATPAVRAANEDAGSVMTMNEAMTEGTKAAPSKIIMSVLAFLILCCIGASFFITSAGIVEFQKNGEWGKLWTKIAGLVMMVCLAGFMGWLVYLEGTTSSLSGAF